MIESRRARVLLIDDEEDPDSGLVLKLQEDGFQVTVVNRAQEVLPTIQKDKGAFDAIILDVMMPSEGYADVSETQGGLTTGALVLKDVRRVLGNIPVLVVSARNRNDARACLGRISEVVEKPASPASIIEKLTGILGQSRDSGHAS